MFKSFSNLLDITFYQLKSCGVSTLNKKKLPVLQENYFGVDQKFTDYEETLNSNEKSSTFTHISMDGKDRVFDPRQYRPLHIKINLTLHDIHAHLVKASVNRQKFGLVLRQCKCRLAHFFYTSL